MNNPTALILIGAALTAFAFGFYVRWRKSSPAAARSNAPAPARPGFERRPPEEISRMFGAGLAVGISLAVLSMYLYADIPEDSPRWIAMPFLAAGLWMVGAGSFYGARVDRPSRIERVAAWLARRLGLDLGRIACLAGGALFLAFAATAAGFYSTDAGLAVMAAALTAGLVLSAAGVRRPRLPE
jgi:O-antigen/teichoic acid export membrane protein